MTRVRGRGSEAEPASILIFLRLGQSGIEISSGHPTHVGFNTDGVYEKQAEKVGDKIFVKLLLIGTVAAFSSDEEEGDKNQKHRCQDKSNKVSLDDKIIDGKNQSGRV